MVLNSKGYVMGRVVYLLVLNLNYMCSPLEAHKELELLFNMC